MIYPLIDIGANLTDHSFDHDRKAVIENAFDKGLETIIVTSSSVKDAKKSISLAKKYPGKLWATAGIHPHNAELTEKSFEQDLTELLDQNEVIALGECGLDYYRNFSSKRSQRAVFKKQLILSAKVQLPLFLHQRDAHDDFLSMLKEHCNYPVKGVAHCFTGTKEQLKSYLDIGLYIGITGWVCDSRRNVELLDAIKYLPKDRLLIETDAPYLMPRLLAKQLKTRRNEPQFLSEIANELAGLMQTDISEISAITLENSKNLFDRLG